MNPTVPLRTPARVARVSAAWPALLVLALALWPRVGAGQSHSEWVHHRHFRLDAPFGNSRVLAMFPRRADRADHPRDERWRVVVALHGQGEARRGPERGFLGWSVDYRLPDAFGALLRGRLTRDDFGGMVRPEHLEAMNAALRHDPFEGLMVVCPYTPDLMGEAAGSERIVQYADWVAGPLLQAVRAEFPGAARGRDATGIDGVSLGGMLALEVGLRHPEAFGSVGAIQPAVRGREAAIAGLASPGSQHVRLMTSDGDPFRGPTQTLSGALRERRVGHDLVVVPGPHDYSFNRGPGGLELLLFHDRALAHEPLGAPAPDAE